MRAFLSESEILAVGGANENRRVVFFRVIKIQSTSRLQVCGAFDFDRRIACFCLRVVSRFTGKTGGTDEKRARCEKKKIAELAPCDLRFFVAVVRKFLLMLMGRLAHVALV